MIPKNTPTRIEAVQMLAEDHFATDQGLRHFFQLRTPQEAQPFSALNLETEQFTPGNPFIKILEVVEDAYEEGIRPLYFSGSTDALGNYWPPLILIRISPREFEALNRGELVLPDGLKMSDARELQVPALASGT